MIRFIKFSRPITIPHRSGVVTLFNAEQDQDIRAEETPIGFALHIGKLEGERKEWRSKGVVVRVPWNMIEYVTERQTAAPVTPSKGQGK